MPKKQGREYRTLSAPLTAQTRAEKKIKSDFYVEGYATTFDDPYVLYEFDGIEYYERIDKDALRCADLSDVIMQYDHEGKVLARQSNGTLEIETDDKGLFMFADLSKSRAAQELFEEINNGLVTKMSWGFTIAQGGIEYDSVTRTGTITKIEKVYDVSAVAYPANHDTIISARSWINGVIDAERREALAREKRIRKLKIKMEALKS